MALLKLISGVRLQIHRGLFVSSRCCSTDTNFDLGNTESENERIRSDINEVIISGVASEIQRKVRDKVTVSFVITSKYFKGRGTVEVRSTVFAGIAAFPVGGVEAINEGQKVLVHARVGSGSLGGIDSTIRFSYLVGKRIVLL